MVFKQANAKHSTSTLSTMIHGQDCGIMN